MTSSRPTVTASGLALGATALVVVLVGCDSASPAADATSPQTSSASTWAGVPTTVDPAFTDPTFVATDSPGPVDDGALEVVLTGADWNRATSSVEANGFVTGVVEDGGTCTLTMRKGRDTASTSKPGEMDATTTNCGLLQVDDLNTGTWEAELTYRSDSGSGTSATIEVDVP